MLPYYLILFLNIYILTLEAQEGESGQKANFSSLAFQGQDCYTP